MRLGTILLAALAAVVEPSRAAFAQTDLPAGAQAGVEPAPNATERDIEHRPVERNVRGTPIVIRAKVANPSRLFTPLVFARPAGTQRFGAYSMVDRGARGFVARLPASLLGEGSFEYFIEARHDEGDATRYATPAKPIVCVAYDPPARPVKATFRTEEPGATLKVDDNDVGKTPVTVAIGPGPHVVQAIAADGRSTEQQLDVKPGRKLDILIPLPARAGGPSSLAVTSEPEQARVFIDGAAVGATPYSGELAPGTHTVAVESTGRQRQERQVVGRPGRDVQLAFVLPAMPKDPALTVESDPVGATVILDGKERGRTPFLAPVPPGRHEVVLRTPGRRDLSIEFAMPRDKDVSLKKELAPTSGAPRLTVSSSPDGAIVAIDGKEVGLTPWSGELKLGEHSIQIRRTGYFAADRTVALQANRDSDLSFALERVAGPGQLRVETDPPDAEVSIDGQKPVTAPFGGEVASGDHNVEVSSPGYRSVAQQISLVPGQQVSLRLTLSANTGPNAPPIVGVNSAPEGAMLYLDGKLIGPTPRKAATTPGQHELRLVLDGYKTWAAPTRLPDKPGYELRVAVALKPVREAEAVVTPAAMELARAQYKRAESCYAAHDYACAVAGYRAAYEQSRRPELLFNIAQAERHLGNTKEALAAYQAFLREKQDANTKVKAQAEQYIAFLQVVAPAGPGAAAGTAVAQKPASQPTLVTPLPSGASPSLAPPLPPVPGADSIAPPLPILPPEEDTQPPVLTHTAVRKATRGTELKLTARIVDERSGVGDAQACWRNLFHIDYECVALTATKNDDYEATIPASALADGFAYYLEATDSLGNGPARSGAPDAPHSVALQEPETALSRAFAEGLQPVTSGGAVPAGFPAGPQQFEIQRPRGGLLEVSRDRHAWTIRAVAGGESSSETYTQGATRAYTALQATRDLSHNFLALVRGEWRSASQPYVLPATVDPQNRAALSEQRYDVVGAGGYELGDLLWPNGRLSLQPMAGIHYMALRNDLSNVDYVGGDLLLRAAYRIIPLLEARTELTYSFPLSVTDSRSPLGHPLREFTLRVGGALPFGSRYALELSYQADFLAFTYVTRSAHGAALGFDTSF